MKASPLRAPQLLEARDLPAVFGVPWLDSSNLTLSFAPDGTQVFGDTSALSATLTSLGSDTARLEILRAFQTWAEQANVNFGLVADGGQAYAADGSIQGDTRFGDIRLFTRQLAANQLAITAPFNVLGGTNAGDVTLNPNAPFSIRGGAGTYDLYSAMLQEAGHSLGIGNSDDPNSPMFEVYGGIRPGLTAGDVASIRALYGARLPDRYEGLWGNDTRSSAALVVGYADAELSSRDDVDFYRFIATGTGATIRLQAAGHSLMTGRLTITNSAGQVLATATAADALHNDLTLKVGNLLPGLSYFVRVDGPRGDVFDVGSYRLVVDSGLSASLSLQLASVSLSLSTSGPLDTASVQNFGVDYGLNDSILTSTLVVPKLLSADSRYDYNFRAVVSSSSDVDYYALTAPLSSLLGGGQSVMLATVWGLGGSAVDPRLAVFDQFLRPAAARVLTNNNGSFTVQLDQPTSGATYFLRVAGDGGTTGQYGVAVDFRTTPVVLDSLSGSLAAGAQSTTYLQVQNQLFHFALSAGPAGGSAAMDVIDASGQIVFSLSARPGDTVSRDVFLATGTYKVRFRTLGSAANFGLALAGLTDPVVSSCDTSGAAAGGSSGGSSGGSTSSSGSSYTFQDAPPPGGSTWY